MPSLDLHLWIPNAAEPGHEKLVTGRSRQEHCSLDAGTLSALGIAVGQQVRITRTREPSLYAVYTVAATHAAVDPPVVRAGPEGFVRVVAPGCLTTLLPFLDSKNPSVNVSTAVVSTLSADEAKTAREFVEESSGTGTGLAILAPHGGLIEEHTDVQAAEAELVLARKPVRRWVCKGWGDAVRGALVRWHITSTEISPASFPRLGALPIKGFQHAVAFHGWSAEGIGIGGGMDPADSAAKPRLKLKNDIRAALIAIGIPADQVRVDPPELDGDSPSNIVNRLTKDDNGIQIEQSASLRASHGTAIARAVAEVYRSLI